MSIPGIPGPGIPNPNEVLFRNLDPLRGILERPSPLSIPPVPPVYDPLSPEFQEWRREEEEAMAARERLEQRKKTEE